MSTHEAELEGNRFVILNRNLRNKDKLIVEQKTEIERLDIEAGCTETFVLAAQVENKRLRTMIAEMRELLEQAYAGLLNRQIDVLLLVDTIRLHLEATSND